MAWRSIYDPIFGGLNPILMKLGLIDERVAWLAHPQLAMPSVITLTAARVRGPSAPKRTHDAANAPPT